MTPRELAPEEVALVGPLAGRAFDDLTVREGGTPRPRSAARDAHDGAQHAHLAATGRALGTFDGDRLLGAALSVVRGDLLVLALLVVEPDAQSSGVGGALLRAALRGAPARLLLHASPDARAVRAYSRAGFRLLPALEATGTVTASTGPAVVEAPDDLPALVPFAVDLPHLRASGGAVLTLADGRPGVAVLHRVPGRGSGIDVLAAVDEATGADLLRGALALVEGPVEVGPLAPQQHWAVPVLLDAGLAVQPCGPVGVAGVPDPLAGTCPVGAVFV